MDLLSVSYLYMSLLSFISEEKRIMSKHHIAIVSILSVQALLLGVCSGLSRLPPPWKHERVPRSGAGW